MNKETRMKWIATLLPGLFFSLLAPLAQAHGTGKPHHGPAKKEQKDWGIAGDVREVRRTIRISMSDQMRFTPDHIELNQGDTVQIVLKNQGQILHEFVIGDKKTLEEHAALMIKFPTMEHDEPYMTHVPPSKSGDMIWHFNRAGEFDFACLIPGHYTAGMVGKITVKAKPGGAK
jgi:uncharacterized cupredoxin-like copper-binding protein